MAGCRMGAYPCPEKHASTRSALGPFLLWLLPERDRDVALRGLAMKWNAPLELS